MSSGVFRVETLWYKKSHYSSFLTPFDVRMWFFTQNHRKENPLESYFQQMWSWRRTVVHHECGGWSEPICAWPECEVHGNDAYQWVLEDPAGGEHCPALLRHVSHLARNDPSDLKTYFVHNVVASPVIDVGSFRFICSRMIVCVRMRRCVKLVSN